MVPIAAQEKAVHRRPHAPPMASPFLEFDLTAEMKHLRDETTWNTGRNSRTIVKYDDFRVVLMALQANMRVSEHKTDGRISIHMLSGHVRLNALGRTFDLRPGSLVALDQGSAHDLEAMEESAFLLTIAWPGRTAPSA
jgi:quercetin dioxygenase-like cupin family protein